MPHINPTLPNQGETADATDISEPFLALLAVFNGHIAADNIEPGSLPWSVMDAFTGEIPAEAMEDAGNLRIFRDETNVAFVANGLVWAALTGLNASMSAGVIYTADGGRTPVTQITSRTFTASKDTYVSISPAGSLNYQEVTNGATSPTIPADYIVLAKVVTNGSAITSISTVGTTSAGNPIYPTANNRIATLRQDDTTFALVKNSTMMWGFGFIAGNGTVDISKAITFPGTFKNRPFVMAQFLGYNTASATYDLSNVRDDWGGIVMHAQKPTTTGFTMRGRRIDGPVTATNNWYYFSWLAIGEIEV